MYKELEVERLLPELRANTHEVTVMEVDIR
jgi:hypothetical protein